MSVSDWADHKALELLPQGKCEDGGNIRIFIARALRDVQRQTAEECCKLVCWACGNNVPGRFNERGYYEHKYPNPHCSASPIRRFLKEGQ